MRRDSAGLRRIEECLFFFFSIFDASSLLATIYAKNIYYTVCTVTMAEAPKSKCTDLEYTRVNCRDRRPTRNARQIILFVFLSDVVKRKHRSRLDIDTGGETCDFFSFFF